MKYLAAILAFALVHCVAAYVWWVSGVPFERGSGAAALAFVCVYVGGTAGWVTVAFWPKE